VGGVRRQLPFPYVVFVGGPFTYKYASGNYKRVSSNWTVGSIRGTALETCTKSHKELEPEIRVYEVWESTTVRLTYN